MTLVPIPQRQGVKTRQKYYPEDPGAPGVDPGSPVGYVMHLADEAGFGSSQNLINAPVFKGHRKPDGVIYGNISAEGENPYGLEFRTFPRILKDFFGPDGYSRPFGGTSKFHRFIIPIDDDAIMGSAQIQDESLETPKQFIRNKGVRPGTINMSYANEGVARYGLGLMGIGEEVYTDLGGTVIDEGYKAVSYFNGSAKLAGYYLAGMTDFRISINGGLSRQDAAFRDGRAAAINYGKVNVTGSLGLMFSLAGAAPENNMNFYNYAVNQQFIPLEIVWADAPLAQANMWCRVVLATTAFSRRGFRPGGTAGKIITQDYQLVDDIAADLPGEKFNETRSATYNLTGTSNKLGVKVDGAATIPVTLPIGGAVTHAAVVAALQASAPLTAVANIEDKHGRVFIQSKTSGGTSSVQIDTAQTDSAHTAIGFDGVADVGLNDTPFKIEVFNDIAVDL